MTARLECDSLAADPARVSSPADRVVASTQRTRLIERFPSRRAMTDDAGGAELEVVLLDPVHLDEADPLIWNHRRGMRAP